MNLDQAYEKYLPTIEGALKQAFEGMQVPLESFYGMMGYHLGWLNDTLRPVEPRVGKRLRPFLCLMTCRACGADPSLALPAAVALELIHNFSLVHDDIQDNSLYRRHRKAVWAIWGQPHAINVGDGLFAMAFLSLARLYDAIAPERVRVVQDSIACACLRLCEGQYLDMSFETRFDVSEDEYLVMIDGKTGALLSYSAYVGAVIGAEDVGRADAFRGLGKQLGLAFQIQDDILGIWGDPKITGKPVADDILQCKKTLPVLFAIRREAELGGGYLSDLYAGSRVDEKEIPRVLDALDAVGARRYAEQVNGQYCDQALEALRASGANEETGRVLTELIERLRERSH